MLIFGMFAHGFAQRIMIYIQAQMPYHRFEQMAEHYDTIVQFVTTRNGPKDNRFTIGLPNSVQQADAGSPARV